MYVCMNVLRNIRIIGDGICVEFGACYNVNANVVYRNHVTYTRLYIVASCSLQNLFIFMQCIVGYNRLYVFGWERSSDDFRK